MTKEKFIKALQDALDFGVSKEAVCDEFKITKGTLSRWMDGTTPPEYVRAVNVGRLERMKKDLKRK